MLKVAILAAAMTVASSAAFASFTVYQGSPRAGKVLGTFDTRHEARAFAREHKGQGESIVNNSAHPGREIDKPGRGK